MIGMPLDVPVPHSVNSTSLITGTPRRRRGHLGVDGRLRRLLEPVPEIRDHRGGILRIAGRFADRDRGSARRDDLVDVVEPDAADRQLWPPRERRGHRPDEGRPARHDIGLRGARRESADAAIVASRLVVPSRLVEIVRAATDEGEPADDASRRLDREIVLAEVDAIRRRGDRHVRSVVHHHRNPGGTGDLDHAADAFDQPDRIEVLLSDLDGIRAAGDHRLEDFRPRSPTGRFGEQHLHPPARGASPRQCDDHLGREVVGRVSGRLDRGRDPATGIEDLRGLLQGSTSFGDPTTRRLRDRDQPRPGQFAGR